MKHLGTKTIETERLILRKLRVEDAEAMFRNWASDPEVTKFLTWPPHASVDATRELLSEWSDNYSKDDYYQWGDRVEIPGRSDRLHFRGRHEG